MTNKHSYILSSFTWMYLFKNVGEITSRLKTVKGVLDLIQTHKIN